MKILALDLGKSNTCGCIFDTSTAEERFVTVRTRPDELCRLLERERPGHVVFEVCTQAGWVHDLVTASGAKSHVANPNHEGWRWRNVKRKTDRLDAAKLAGMLAMRQLPEVHMPSRRVREQRALISYRQQLVARQTRIKNTVHSLLLRRGIVHPRGRHGWTQKARAQLAELARPWDEVGREDLWRAELGEELEALEQTEQRLVRVERKLDELARGDERIQRLQTIPCVGPRTAELLAAVIDDPRRFRSGKQVGSYVGLVPRQYQSGQMDRSGHISKQGHRELRSLLVEVSWLALRYNPHLRSVFERICRGTRSRRKIAIVAVARKLVIIAWAMLRDGTTWRPRRLAA